MHLPYPELLKIANKLYPLLIKRLPWDHTIDDWSESCWEPNKYQKVKSAAVVPWAKKWWDFTLDAILQLWRSCIKKKKKKKKKLNQTPTQRLSVETKLRSIMPCFVNLEKHHLVSCWLSPFLAKALRKTVYSQI